MNADEIRSIVAEVVADAEGRTSLAGDAVGGFDGRFFLADPSSGFRLSMTGEYQARYLATFDAEEAGADEGDGFESGFQVQNVRLDFRGSVLGDRIAFRVMPAYERGTGDLNLLDAYADVRLGEARLRIGQFALPFTREFSVSPTRQVGADRSLADFVFRLSRSQGVMVMRDWDRVRVAAALSDGVAALNTDYDDTDEADVALSGRVEGRLLDGPWKQYDTAYAVSADDAGMMVGMAGHWQRAGRTSAPSSFDDDADRFQGTGDLTWKSSGWTVGASGFARHIDGGSGEHLTDFGVMAHASVVVADHVDVFARYVHLWPDGDRPGGSDDFSTIEAGGSWCLVPGSPVARITAQVIWAPEAQGDSASLVTAPNTSAGILPDDSGGQVTFLVQVQVVF